MKNGKMKFGLMILAVLACCGLLQAGTYIWDGEAADGVFGTNSNWVGDVGPQLYGGPGDDCAVIANGDTVTRYGDLFIGNTSGSTGGELRLLNGSSWTATGAFILGTSSYVGNTTGATGIVHIGNGCSITTNAAAVAWISIEPGNTFIINFDGIASWSGDSAGTPAAPDIRVWDTGWAWQFSSAEDLWDRGILTHNGGQVGTFADNFEVLADGTIVSIENGAYDPLPTSGSDGIATDVSLSWDLAGSYTPIEYKLYVRATNPNFLETGSNLVNGVSVAPALSGRTSYPLSNLDGSTEYFWRVDAYEPNIPDPNLYTGSTWSFTTVSTNESPTVDAGDSIVTWVANAATGTIQLQGVVDDNGEGDIVSQGWTVLASDFPGIPAPGITFTDAADPITTVTITEAGIYTLVYTVDDGVNPEVSDAMEFAVYADACLAAKNNPNVPYEGNYHDYNNDCIVNILDFVIFAAEWLEDTTTTQDEYYPKSIVIEDTDVLLWLDASDAATLTTDAGGITTWADKSFNGNDLTSAGTVNPVLLTAALNGLDVVDFGVLGTDSWMQFAEVSGIESAFWVVKGENSLLGGNSNHYFLRGITNQDGLDGGIEVLEGYIWDDIWSDAGNQPTYLNGAPVDGEITVLPATYSIVSQTAPERSMMASRLGSDLRDRSGGLQVAELILFNRFLSDSERTAVESYLSTKWGVTLAP